MYVWYVVCAPRQESSGRMCGCLGLSPSLVGCFVQQIDPRTMSLCVQCISCVCVYIFVAFMYEKTLKICKKGWAQRHQASVLALALCRLKFPFLHYNISRCDRWAATRDWLSWLVHNCQRLCVVLAPLCPCTKAIFTLLFKPFPSSSTSSPSPLELFLLLIASSSYCRSLSHPFQALEASLLPWFPSSLVVCASSYFLFMFSLGVTCCSCMFSVLGLLYVVVQPSQFHLNFVL